MSSTFVYRVLNASWGIHISFTARADSRASRGLRLVEDKEYWLKFASIVESLSQAEIEEFARGLRHVASEVLAAGGPPLVVVVESISYVESDYQAEGLSVAALRWIEQEFGLRHHVAAETFDRDANRYVFEWEGPDH